MDLNLAAPRLHDLGYAAHDAEAPSSVTPPLCAVPAGPFLMGSDPTTVRASFGFRLVLS